MLVTVIFLEGEALILTEDGNIVIGTLLLIGSYIVGQVLAAPSAFIVTLLLWVGKFAAFFGVSAKFIILSWTEDHYSASYKSAL